MKLNIAAEVAVLQEMTVTELKVRYAELFGDGTNTGNKVWLVKRIAWRLQAQAEGGLSQRARERARELANEADIRMSPPPMQTSTPAPERTVTASFKTDSDDRLPPVGTILTRKYKGKTVQVQVLADGFAWNDDKYGALSAVAKAITGSHVNGYHFFKLNKEND